MGSCILFLKMVNSDAKNSNSLGLLQMCINHKALNLLLSSFFHFCSRGLVVPRFPWVTACPKLLNISMVNRFSNNNKNNNSP